MTTPSIDLKKLEPKEIHASALSIKSGVAMRIRFAEGPKRGMKPAG